MFRSAQTGHPETELSRAGLVASPGSASATQAGRSDNYLPKPPSTLRRQAGNIAAICLAFLIFIAITTGGRSLHHSGYRIMTIHGSSMGDTVPIGSVVLAQWRTPADIKVGDVILVEEEVEGEKMPPKLHRIISLDETDGVVTVETKGDGNAAADPLPFVMTGDALVYRNHLPRVGYWLSVIQTPIGWLLAIALPFTLATGAILVSIWRGDKRSKPAAA